MGDATCQPRLGGGERNTRTHAYYIHIWRLIATILNSTDRPKRQELALVLSNFTVSVTVVDNSESLDRWMHGWEQGIVRGNAGCPPSCCQGWHEAARGPPPFSP